MAWYGNFQKLLIMHLRFYIQSFFRTNSEHFSVSRKIKKNSSTIFPKKVHIFFPQNTFLKNNLSKLPNCCLFEFVSNSFAIFFFSPSSVEQLKTMKTQYVLKEENTVCFFMIVFIRIHYYYYILLLLLLYIIIIITRNFLQ